MVAPPHDALSLGTWRREPGTAVRQVSERLGYSQPSTFIAAFRRVMKVTPGAYHA